MGLLSGSDFFICRKGIRYVFSFLLILLIVFLIPRLLPGDPVANLVGEDVYIPASTVADIRQSLDLDKPLYEQFLKYCSHLARLDLGYSYHLHTPVVSLISDRIGWTLLYVGSAVFLGAIIGVLVGARTGWEEKKWWAILLTGSSLFISSVPPYLLGLLFLVTGVYHLGWFPFKGFYDTCTLPSILHHIALPVIVLTLFYASRNLLIMRGAVIAEKGLLYPQFARALGITPLDILNRHVRRNAIIPLITMIALDFGFLFSGALFIEIVFSLNGMGSLMYDAILLRDYPVLTGLFLIISILVILANITADILILILDPRVRSER